MIRSRDAAIGEDDVIATCRNRIASFKIPRRIFFVDTFPLTGSGKIQKHLLREAAQNRLKQAG